MPSISDINEEYFGKDRSKNYLKDDFSRVLHGVVQRSVLIEVLIESSKARHNEKEHVDKDGNKSIAYGDFDPDNAGFLWSIYESYQKGVMVDVRQLLHPKEKGTGGKFIKDLTKLNVDDFLDYYKTDKAYTIPPILLGKYLKEKETNKQLSVIDFIDNHRAEIENIANQLIKRAAAFHGEDYFNQIVKDYQALKFHKDIQPEKYDVTEVVKEFGFLKERHTTRRDKANIEITKIAEYLNEFAEIISLYQKLVSSNTSFFRTSWPLETYVERTFALFAKEVPVNAQTKVSEEVVQYLDASLRVAGWEHKHPKQKQ